MSAAKYIDALHAAVMNLPCKNDFWNDAAKQAYREGHRDARHAAAELVSAYGAGEPLSVPMSRETRQAVEHMRAALQFAYEQGLHEFGYDPLQTLLDVYVIDKEAGSAA